MKTLTQIQTIVRDYLDNASADVNQSIIDSINFLSNIFYIDSFDTSQSTAVDGTTLNFPTDSLSIDAVFIDNEEILPMDDLNKLQHFDDNSEQRWYEYNDKIQFTKAFTSIKTTNIMYRKGFKEPTSDVVTDVPEKYMELVYLGAQFRFYNILIAQVVQKREDVPDISPYELRLVRNDIKKTYLELIDYIKSHE